MGLSIYERKRIALKAVKLKLPPETNIYLMMDFASEAIDCYINAGETRSCKNGECGTVISARNKTGYCRRCYKNKYRKKGQQKRLDALRQKYYRKRKKLEGWKAVTKLVCNGKAVSVEEFTHTPLEASYAHKK